MSRSLTEEIIKAGLVSHALEHHTQFVAPVQLLQRLVDAIEAGKPEDLFHSLASQLEAKPQLTDEQRAALDLTVDRLEISVRASNALEDAHIKTVRELLKQSRSHLLKVKNFGKKCLEQVEHALEKHNLRIGMNLDE